MALKDPQFRSSGDPMEGSDAEELEELEAGVKEMAQKVRHYRTTLPDQLRPHSLRFYLLSDLHFSNSCPDPNPKPPENLTQVSFEVIGRIEVDTGGVCGNNVLVMEWQLQFPVGAFVEPAGVEEMGTIVDVVVMWGGGEDYGGRMKRQSRVLLLQGDHETSEKIQLLKQKISSNVSTIPVLLKRLNECMSMVDKLDSYNGIMHPAFKRRRTS
ncbi:hypothetical protein CK203_106740 [Vitis vinifera]|uniref:Uncharacterized protein n=1 Tax=Vitis vinifera TaxID=29760 RepID=A0A438FGC7_VITVI|nr:hypothetical protein CK203_106740 [Vitis vinifera]